MERNFWQDFCKLIIKSRLWRNLNNTTTLLNRIFEGVETYNSLIIHKVSTIYPNFVVIHPLPLIL